MPIFISTDIETKKRVVILFYENNQDLGVLAHRIIGGKGGINEGSVINMVKYIQSQKTYPGCDEAPGIIIANIGELRWWRRGRKAVTYASWYALPAKSAVEPTYACHPIKNTVPGNRDTKEHVAYIFDHVVRKMADPDAKLNVIGVSEGAIRATEFLDDEKNWKTWSKRMEAYAAVATYTFKEEFKTKAFGEWFRAVSNISYIKIRMLTLKSKRGRTYITSEEPCGTFLAGPNGHRRVEAYGSPTFSLGESFYTEAMLPKGYKTIIDWFQEVAEDSDYANPEIVRFDHDDDHPEGESDMEAQEEGVTLTPVAKLESDDGLGELHE